jgi:hypothetical protein
MNLLSVKRELAQLKALARNRVGSGCVCEYVEIVDGQPLTIEQEHILANNRDCFQRSENREVHVGWSSMTIPANV